MENWRLFELNCVDYLNNIFSNHILKFLGTGQSDSTTSDIVALKNGQVLFNIECKMPDAQSGQFVLFQQNNQFVFSAGNKTEENEFTDLIISYMNDNFEYYKNVTTKSMSINLPPTVFENWIKGHYINKGVKFIITSERNGNHIIFPISEYGKYFEIKADFRIKTSGSSHLSRSYENTVINLFKLNYGPCSIEWDGKKAYLVTSLILSEKIKMADDNHRYQLNKDGNKYLVKMLSNTHNANVIFRINLQKNQSENDLNCFKEFL
ncbi:hypothetical protein [Clostridium estertheticum]|uniref:hypothetical protein n=1 Tax=Clostridium estertheticum TaxID=238834 RepID=UPI001CF56744|nr:hypothetical protein [Clostridium estertheticum]MCB2356902.1 hypothetical protein [Clostridium estertheticum]WAG44022.1 hypothetical protein LL065_25970 [Clostridium estertheticum]